MWADNETAEDLLGFKVHADLLIDVIKDDKVLPVTIGVFGDWGSGKSSILKIVHEELSGEDDELKDDTLVLYFNGWVFEGYDDAKAALLESIIEKFEHHKTIGNKVKDKTTKLLKSVKWMRVLGLGFKRVVLPTAAAYFTGGLSLIPFLAQELSKLSPTDIADKLSGENAEKFLGEITKQHQEDDSTLVREFRDDFKKMIEQSKIKKLVVIIDDLDRCTPERIIENLEAIKLFLNVEKTAFVIGADPRIVRHAIEFRYTRQRKVDEDSNERIVDDYLEKLIQIPYNLPKLSDSEVETYISLLVCKRELSTEAFEKVAASFHAFRSKDRYSVFGLASIKNILGEDDQQRISKSLLSIPALAPIITQTLYGNPRQIKRFLNTLTLRQRLASVARLSGFDDSILSKLMVLEYAEPILFKQLYDWQVTQNGKPEQLKQLEEKVKSASDRRKAKTELEKTEEFKNWSKDRIINWLSVDPTLSAIDLSDYFWLSRDKIASTIPSASLIPPIIKSLYQKLDQDAMTDAVSKKIILEEVLVLAEHEKNGFLEFAAQILAKNHKKKRAYDILTFCVENNLQDAESIYARVLNTLPTKEIPPAVGVALKRLSNIPAIKEYLDKIEQSSTGVGRASKKAK